MTLSSLIRKRSGGNFAIAISAIPAIPQEQVVATVARVATVAVATSSQGHSTRNVDGPATASRWWLIDYPERDPLQVACCPTATQAEVLQQHPHARAAEPFEPVRWQAAALMTADDEKVIRQWLALIEETDPATIADVLNQCQQDADARDYYLQWACEGLQAIKAHAVGEDDGDRVGSGKKS